jgi:hypothetical protein
MKRKFLYLKSALIPVFSEDKSNYGIMDCIANETDCSSIWFICGKYEPLSTINAQHSDWKNYKM